MKRLILCVVGLLSIFGLSAQQANPDAIATTGYAERTITPDKFTISIVIAESDSKGKVSVEAQESEMFRALRAAGIDTREALRLADNYANYNRRSAFATKRYELTIYGSEQLADAFAVLNTLNLSSVNLTKAACSDIRIIRDELRREAIRNARDNATILAEAIDQNIGRCISINDHHYYGDELVVPMRTKSLRENGAVDTAVADEYFETLEFSETKISHSVNATFLLLP